jgi:hypothetical protein
MRVARKWFVCGGQLAWFQRSVCAHGEGGARTNQMARERTQTNEPDGNISIFAVAHIQIARPA